jgi:hypothetical protein
MILVGPWWAIVGGGGGVTGHASVPTHQGKEGVRGNVLRLGKCKYIWLKPIPHLCKLHQVNLIVRAVAFFLSPYVIKNTPHQNTEMNPPPHDSMTP